MSCVCLFVNIIDNNNMAKLFMENIVNRENYNIMLK
jgi:hypothetical protein